MNARGAVQRFAIVAGLSSPLIAASASAQSAAADSGGAAVLPGILRIAASLGTPAVPSVDLRPSITAPIPSLTPTIAASARPPSPTAAPASPRPSAAGVRAAEEGWRDGAFQAADGARIHYRARAGRGPTLLLVHGRSVDGDGWGLWTRAFPGRAMMILDRRGYGGSETGSETESDLGEHNTEDVAQALGIASKLGHDGKTAIVAISLGAMLLPRTLDPDEVAWIALLNPGVFGMLRHMDARTTATSWGLINGLAWSRYWTPAARASWIDAAGDAVVDDLLGRLRGQAAGGAFGADLARRIEASADTAYKELIIRETVWALTATGPLSVDPRIPVFLGASDSDELIPRAAVDELRGGLASAGSRVRPAHWPGGHLTPLLEPDQVLPQLQAFDRELAR